MMKNQEDLVKETIRRQHKTKRKCHNRLEINSLLSKLRSSVSPL